MSFTKPKTRTSIGTLRKVSLSTESSSVKLPPLTKDTSGSSLQNGLQGNAMAVPPAKESPEPRRSSRENVKVRNVLSFFTSPKTKIFNSNILLNQKYNCFKVYLFK